MTSRALSFGAAAAAYDRFRPGYPPELVDLVVGYAGRPVRTALEIGAGTGKATRAFTAKGIRVTATEPDAAMLAQLARRSPEVETIQAAFEDISPDAAYDLVFAAAAMHWTTPEGRWDRVAALLNPGGVFASFGGQLELADADLGRRVVQARSPYLQRDDIPSPDGTDPSAELQWPATELAATELFTDVEQHTLARSLTLAADDYLQHLSTISAYLQLTEPQRTSAFAAIREVLPDDVELAADLTVHLARKAG